MLEVSVQYTATATCDRCGKENTSESPSEPHAKAGAREGGMEVTAKWVNQSYLEHDKTFLCTRCAHSFFEWFEGRGFEPAMSLIDQLIAVRGICSKTKACWLHQGHRGPCEQISIADRIAELRWEWEHTSEVATS